MNSAGLLALTESILPKLCNQDLAQSRKKKSRLYVDCQMDGFTVPPTFGGLNFQPAGILALGVVVDLDIISTLNRETFWVPLQRK